MLDFYRQQLAKVEEELQKLYVDKPLSTLETEGAYSLRIEKFKKEREEHLINIQEEERRLKALKPVGFEVNHSHLPMILEELQKELALNNSRTDFLKQDLLLNVLMDNLYGERLAKVKESSIYRKEFDPKNLINSLFDEILYGTTQVENRHFVGKLGTRCKLDIQQVRTDKKDFRYWERSVLVSGITLSLAIEYDIEKINLLIDFINDREPFVWKKALVGLYLILEKHDLKLKKDKSLIAKLKNLRTQPDVQYALIKIGQAHDTLDADIDMIRMFSEGTKQLSVKTHFDIPQHWFTPFYENNAVLEDSDMEEPLKSLFTNSVCWQNDAFKYAFCKNYDTYSDEQKNRLVEIFENESKDYEELYQKELCFQYPDEGFMEAAKEEEEIKQYIHELFYFFHAFPKDSFQTLFENKIQFHNTRVSQIVATAETHKTLKINAFYNMGLAYSNKGDNDKAIECYQKAIEIKPDKHEAFNNMGSAYDDKGDKDKAIKCYQKAIDIKPDFHEAFYNMGLAYSNKGDKDKAIECYQKAIEIKPDSHDAFYSMGNAYSAKGDKDKAIECYQKAIEIKPDKHEAFCNMGSAYDDKGDKDKAIECYQKAIDIKPDFHEAFNNMGSAYGEKGDKDKAIECYQKAIEIKPDKHDAFNNMGNAYLNKGDNDKAIECYQKAIDIKPDFHEAFYNMGYAYDNKGDNDKAIECYQKAIEIKPDYRDALMSIGFDYLKMKDLPNSEKYLIQAISFGSNDFGNMNLGHIYLCKSEEEKALECYQMSLSHFVDKAYFGKGMKDDYQYLAQYGITEAYYQTVLAKIVENTEGS
jgi:tetratricopeptide (TPR) repeat protein